MTEFTCDVTRHRRIVKGDLLKRQYLLMTFSNTINMFAYVYSLLSCSVKNIRIQLKLEGERVDLLSFAPVCLPSHGQSFAGELEGTVGGKFFKNVKQIHSKPICLTGWGVTKEGGFFPSDNLKVVQVNCFLLQIEITLDEIYLYTTQLQDLGSE